MSRLPTQSIFGNGVPVPEQVIRAPQTNGGALGGIARGATQLGGVLEELQKEKKRAADAAELNGVYHDTNRFVQDLSAGLQKQDPHTSVESYDSATDSFIADRVKGINDPEQQQRIKQIMYGIVDPARKSVRSISAGRVAVQNRAGVLSAITNLGDDVRSGAVPFEDIDKRTAVIKTLASSHLGSGYNEEQLGQVLRTVDAAGRTAKIGVITDELNQFSDDNKAAWLIKDKTDKDIAVKELRSELNSIVELGGMTKSESAAQFRSTVVSWDTAAFQERLTSSRAGAVVDVQNGKFNTLGLPGRKVALTELAINLYNQNSRFEEIVSMNLGEGAAKEYDDLVGSLPSTESRYAGEVNDADASTILNDTLSEIERVQSEHPDQISVDDARRLKNSVTQSMASTRLRQMADRTSWERVQELLNGESFMPEVQGELRQNLKDLAKSRGRAEINENQAKLNDSLDSIRESLLAAEDGGLTESEAAELDKEIASKLKGEEATGQRVRAKASVRAARQSTVMSGLVTEIESAKRSGREADLPTTDEVNFLFRGGDLSAEQHANAISRIGVAERQVHQRNAARRAVTQAITHGELVDRGATSQSTSDAYRQLPTERLRGQLISQLSMFNMSLPKEFYDELELAGGINNNGLSYDPTRLQELVGQVSSSNQVLARQIASSNPLYGIALYRPDMLESMRDQNRVGQLFQLSTTFDTPVEKGKPATWYESAEVLAPWLSGNFDVSDIDPDGGFSNELRVRSMAYMLENGETNVQKAVTATRSSLEDRYDFVQDGDILSVIDKRAGLHGTHKENQNIIRGIPGGTLQYDGGFEQDGKFYTPVTVEVGGEEIIAGYAYNHEWDKASVILDQSIIPPASKLINRDGVTMRLRWLIKPKNSESDFLSESNPRMFDNLLEYAERVFVNATGHLPSLDDDESSDGRTYEGILNTIARTHGWAGARKDAPK